MLDGGPGRVQPFRAVIRILAGHTFAPTVDPVTVRGYQENTAAISSAKTRLKKMDERHVNFAECDGFEFHIKPINTEGAEESQRPRLLPMAQQELAVALPVAFVSQDGQALGKGVGKLFTVS